MPLRLAALLARAGQGDAEALARLAEIEDSLAPAAPPAALPAAPLAAPPAALALAPAPLAPPVAAAAAPAPPRPAVPGYARGTMASNARGGGRRVGSEPVGDARQTPTDPQRTLARDTTAMASRHQLDLVDLRGGWRQVLIENGQLRPYITTNAQANASVLPPQRLTCLHDSNLLEKLPERRVVNALLA
ncbi:hypothetical protein B0T16DRAFT_450990 [Cercophora newfieldiana]|uniref:Uncharacterized protein n=1 Tax=Cercophora newfieldiana TaxID=92897 RepID=A0AA39YMI8_9PEZI|nr:hypothetical protein B0T16DRAFT_450990 [Cercophora newfieldiana]